MAQAPPLRRRDRKPRLDDDFYASDDPYDRRGRNVPRSEEPPRRHKSERARRRPSPDYDYDDGPRRGHGRREPSPRGLNGAGRRRPSPSFDPEPRHRSRRDPHDDFAPPRNRDKDRHVRDPYRDPSPRSPSRRDRRTRGPPDDFDPYSRRSRNSPESKPRVRDMPPPGYADRGGPDPRGHRSRPSSPPRGSHRGRDMPPLAYGGFDDQDDGKRSHRPRSQGGRAATRDLSPGRGRPPPASAGRSGPSAQRRNSMPASAKPGQKGGNNWWKNPLLVAGARTAFSAGAQAAMKNRNDPSPWIGPKGAKVATAAIGAALADGFMQKGTGNKDEGKREGKSSSKSDFISQGMNAFLNRGGGGGGGGGSRSRH